MTALDLTTLQSIASIDFDDFKTNYHTLGDNVAADYYGALNGAATTAGLTYTANYANRASDTANDSGVSGSFENEYSKEVAAGASVDLSVGSDAWLQVQFNQMQADLLARQTSIEGGGTGELTPEATLAVISASYEGVSGLDASASPLYVPLQQLSVSDPSAAQALLNNYYAPDSGSVTGGVAHLLASSVELGFGAVISGDEGLSGILGGWSNQAAWVGTMLTTANNLITGGGITLPDDMAATLGNLAGIFGLAAGELGTLAKWTDGFSSAPDNSTHTDPDWLTAPIGHFGNGESQHSPLVIDLSSGHTGIALTAFDAATTTTYYDLDRTGFAEQTAWITGDTGFLAQENTDGSINLFGTSTTDGFAELAKLDSNHDLKIDSGDTDWGTLNVWLDSNGNGVVDPGELQSLSSLGISSIDLAGITPSTTVIDGNPISHTGTVMFSDGDTSEIADAWLVRSTVNTIYDGNYTLDDQTLFLPNLRGFGTVSDLDVSMSQDSTLEGLVSDFASGFSPSSFADPSTLDSDVTAILYRWAGVAGVDPSSRGPDVDAQDLAFLEKLFGQTFSQFGNPNPDVNAAALLETAWQEVRDAFKAELLVQTGAVASLFDSPVTYNPWTGTFDGTFHLSETGIANLATYAPTTTEAAAEAFWVGVADFIDNTEGISNLTMDEQSWLDSAVTSTTTIAWSDVVGLYDHSGVTGTYIDSETDYDTITGTNGDDQIYVTGSHSTVNETAGNNFIQLSSGGDYGNYNTVHLGSGDNTLYMVGTNNTVYCDSGINTINASGGHDTFNMGTGGNTISAAGNDTFVYGGGDAVITEHGGTNLIVLPSGITSGGVSFFRIASDDPSHFDDLLIQFSDGGSIQVKGEFNALSSSQEIQTLEFSDSSTVDLTALTGMTWLVTGGETVTVPSGAGDADIQLAGGGNYLTLSNGSSNTVEFMSGGNHVNGGSGNDTYVAGPGYNIVDETAGTNTIQIPTGYTMDDVTLSRVNGIHGPTSDLLVTIAGLGEIQFVDEFTGSGYGVQNFHFMDDNSTVAMSSLSIGTIGTAGDDSLSGVAVNAGGNWFDGRGGDDSFTGGVGDNTFIFNAGFGTDTVSETSNTGTNSIEFHGLDPANIRMWTDTSGNLHLQDITDPTHSITVDGGVTGSGTHETTIGTYLEQISFDDPGNTTWNLTGGLTLTGTSGGESIYGSAHGDTIYSMGGDDTLYGNGGNDTYVLPSNFGNVAIHESLSAGTDTVHLTGIDPDDVSVSTDSSGNLLIQKIGDASHTITLYGGLSGGNSTIGSYIESIAFDNGTTWDLTSGLVLTATNTTSTTLTGTSGNDIITIGTGGGTINAGDGNDIVNGNSGNETLNGGAGNDILTGKAGTDTLNGGAGNDTYVFGSGWGSDTINESLSSGTDTIHFAGLNPSDIRMYTDTNGYLHLVNNNNAADNITVTAAVTGNNFHESAIGNYVEQVTFDNGTTWDLTNGVTLTNTNSGGTLYGTAHDDTLVGGTGVDSFNGNAGNDTIISGGGADSMSGGPGNDTYVFAPGFGNATVTESTGAGTDSIHFTGIDPANIRMWTDTSGSLHLQDLTNPSTNITVTAGQTGNNFHESTIGNYVESVTFDSSYATTWDLTGGLTLSNTNSGGTLLGTAFGDTLVGGTGVDSFNGNAGNDTIISGGGADSMSGGPGNDTYVFAPGFGSATVSESTSGGTDTIHFTGIDPADIRMYTDSSGGLHFQDTSDPSHNITVSGATTGSGFHESAIGLYVEQATFDSAYGTTWDLTGGLALSDTNSGGSLYGTANADTLSGGTGVDSLYGNGGDDLIYGGGGADNLTGGTGADTFLFKGATAETGVVTIADFSTAQGDKLDIADVISFYDPLTMAIANFVQVSVVSGSTQIKVDTDGSGTSYTEIATLSGVTGHTLSDLITDGNLVVHHT